MLRDCAVQIVRRSRASSDAGRPPGRVVSRARIVRASADGRSGNEICELVGVSRPMVTRWLDRYEEAGFEGLLEDQPRSGRPREGQSGTRSDDRAPDALDEAPPDEGTHSGHAHHGQGDGRQSEHHVAHLAKPRAPASSDRLPQTLDRLAWRSCATSWGSISILPSGPWSFLSMRRARSKLSTAPSRGCHSRRAGQARRPSSTSATALRRYSLPLM